MRDNFFVLGPQWLFSKSRPYSKGAMGTYNSSPVTAMYMARFGVQLVSRTQNEITFEVVKNRSANGIEEQEPLLRGMFPNLVIHSQSRHTTFTIRDDDLIAFDLMEDTAMKIHPGVRYSPHFFVPKR